MGDLCYIFAGKLSLLPSFIGFRQINMLVLMAPAVIFIV